MTTWKSLIACVALIAVLSGGVLTQGTAQSTTQPSPPKNKEKGKEGVDPAASKDPASTKKPATYKVEKKPFKIELAVKGVLEPEEATWIAYHPQPTSPFPPALTVRKVAEHGAKVRQGDLLVAFDTQKIDQAIRQLEAEIKNLESNIKLAELEQLLLEKAVPIDLELAERAKHEADEDLAYFLKTSRTEMEKHAQFQVRIAEFFLEYAKEQLRQLEKMYKANDLTEETEQIILKRQRFMVEYETLYYKSALIERDWILSTALPRREKSLRDGVVKQTLSLEKARNTLAPMVAQKEQNLAKMRFDLDRSKNGLEMLNKDRATMTIVAPTEGVVYYGKLSKGQWEAPAAIAGKLVPEGMVGPNEVIMTIVKPGRLVVRSQIEEKDVHLVKVGLTGKARMVFNPDRKLPAKVTMVSTVPAAPDKFEIQVALDIGIEADLVPGMACSIKFVPYSQKQALIVPSTAVFEEDDTLFVNVVDKKGKTEQRRVTPGRTNEAHTEILDGLREGEEILLERPDANKPAPAPSKGGKDS